MRPISDWFAFRRSFFSSIPLNITFTHLKNKTNSATKLLSDPQDPVSNKLPLFLSSLNHNAVKKPLLVGGLLAAGLALQGFTAATQLDEVIESHKLRVVSVAGDSTYFSQDSFLHGFGYEMSREFARDLNVDFVFMQVPNADAAFDLVKKGKADIALTTATSAQLHANAMSSVDLSCGSPETLSREGLNPILNWSFKNGADPLTSSSHGFVCAQRQVGSTKQLAAFYSHQLMNDQTEKTAFIQAMNTRLPILRASFLLNAKQQHLDWQLLTAVSYQESHLVPTAISPTGVSGIMMLTQGTAAAMGVHNRNNPAESIKGGAAYLKLMQDQYASIPNPDRIWFSLAAYNMGAGNVDRVRALLKKAGKNPDSWINVYQYLSNHAAQNAQYGQCMHYVTRIRGYLEAMKQGNNSNLTHV